MRRRRSPLDSPSSRSCRLRPPRALVGLLVGCCLLPACTATGAPLRFSVAFSDGARLGRSTSINVALRVDPTLPPVTEVRILTAAGLTLSSSRLGVASCVRPAVEIVAIMNPLEAARRCPANSLIGTGTATAGLLFEPAVLGAATIELHAGAPVDDKPGLVILVDTYKPARMQLTYVGYLYVPLPAFGLGLAIKIPPIPKPPFGAQLALSTFVRPARAASASHRRRAGASSGRETARAGRSVGRGRGRRSARRARRVALARACGRTDPR
jgi:hypothetical protein